VKSSIVFSIILILSFGSPKLAYPNLHPFGALNMECNTDTPYEIPNESNSAEYIPDEMSPNMGVACKSPRNRDEVLSTEKRDVSFANWLTRAVCISTCNGNSPVNTKYTLVRAALEGSSRTLHAFATSTCVVIIAGASSSTTLQIALGTDTNRLLLNLTLVMCATSDTITLVLKSTSMAEAVRPRRMMPESYLELKKRAIADSPVELINRYCFVMSTSVVSKLQSPLTSPIG